jgi:hypothetical protein
MNPIVLLALPSPSLKVGLTHHYENPFLLLFIKVDSFYAGILEEMKPLELWTQEEVQQWFHENHNLVGVEKLHKLNGEKLAVLSKLSFPVYSPAFRN